MGKNKNKKKGGAQAAAANSNDPDAIKVCKMVILTKLTCIQILVRLLCRT